MWIGSRPAPLAVSSHIPETKNPGTDIDKVSRRIDV